jgi:hypothetical protein
MRRALVTVIVVALPLFGGHAAAAERSGDPLGAWIGELRKCTDKNPPRIAVLGFDRNETAVSREEADHIRLDIENRLQARGLALTPGADVTRLKDLLERTTGLSDAEVEKQIRAAFDGDAAIFFVSPDRQTGRVRFRLQAITRAADCKATSDTIELALTAPQSLAEVSQVMANAVKHLVEAAPNVRAVDVLPFSALAGHSICSVALTDTLMVALDAEARDPDRVLKGKTLTATKVTAPRPAEGGRVSAHGTFELDRDSRAFISLEFKDGGGATIAPTGRVAIDRLGCDPTIRPFLDHVATSARTDRSRLDLSAPVFKRHDRLEVLITLSRPMSLYCWVLAPDGNGYVALPVSGQSASVKAGTLRYPRDFGKRMDETLGDNPFENLFACFGTEHDLPLAIDQQWQEHAPGEIADAKLIEPIARTITLMNEFRALPGIVEATARIVVR